MQDLDPASWPAVNRLLDEALALPPADRADWLDALPAEHAPLRQTLERLLGVQAEIETGDFLGTLPRLAGGSAWESGGLDGAPQPGAVVGPWRLLRELGRGGMGSVWLAERADGALRRQVALKLPRLAWAQGLGTRLARERDILASLEHPHIARLYDAGVDTLGRPWLALEFVDGQPLNIHARERALPPRQRVQLLLQVAAAVAYAHGRLVIHRDLKPSNILVSAAGEVKLLDFGIAKLLEADRAQPTELTQQAGPALTPDYASPEQIGGGPLGTASDVYGLGVVAYELLAGVRPYRLRRGSAAELEEAIATLDAPRASAVAGDPAAARALRGDLDAILAQALRKDPAQRYPTVQALADDWQRWLDGRPVHAMPDRLGYRLRRTLRRHWLPATAGTAVAVALLAGAGLALWQARQARAAQAAAEHEAATARAVQGFLESVFLENRGDQNDPGVRRQATALDLLDRGADRIARDLQGAPAARLRLLQVLGGMYEDLGRFDRMRELYALRVEQARLVPGAQGARETALALADLAHAEASSGREADARGRLDEAEALLARHPDPQARLRLLVRRGSVHRADDGPRAARAAAEALALARTLPVSHDLVLALFLVAEGEVYGGSAPRGLELLDEVIALIEGRPELGASLLAPLHSLRGDALRRLRRPDAAETAYRHALDVEQRRGATAVTLNYLTLQLGMFLYDQDRWADSAAALQPAWNWARGQDDGFDTTVPMAGAGYGRALLALGRVEEGAAALRRAAAQVRSLQDAPDVLPRILLLQAQAETLQRRWIDAEKLIAEAEAVISARGTGQEPFARAARRELLLARGEGPQALASWRAERRAAGEPEVPPATAAKLPDLVTSAQLHLAAGQGQPALEQARAAIEAAAAAPAGSPGSLPSVAARAHHVLGRAWLAAGRPGEAVEPLQQAVQRWSRLNDPALGLELAQSLQDLARAQQLSRSGDAGSEARARAAAILARHAASGRQHRQATGS